MLTPTPMLQTVNPNKSADITEYTSYYCNIIEMLDNPKDQETRIISALTEMNDNLEYFMNKEQFNVFYQTSLPAILRYLSNAPKNFFMEHNSHLIKKHLLEFLSRFPFSEVKNYLQNYLTLLYNLLENDNEDISLIALRIISDIHKKIHPHKLNEEARKLLNIIRKFTMNLLQNVNLIFEPRDSGIQARDLSEIDIEKILSETFTGKQVYMMNNENTSVFYNVLPRGSSSLKVLMEIPITIILLCQVYRNFIENEVYDLLQLSIRLVSLQPTPAQKSHPSFRNEIFIDFLNVQAKFMSFIVYIARTQEDKFDSMTLADKIPPALINIFKNCPPEISNLRKDLLYSTRYVIGTRFRTHFAPYIEQLLDESVLIGAGWTCRESHRSFSYSVIYDLVHHLRDSVGIPVLENAINIYSKNLFDEMLVPTIHIMCCRVLLNLMDSYQKRAQKENNLHSLRSLFMKIFKVFTDKLSSIEKYSLPTIKAKVSSSHETSEATAASTGVKTEANDDDDPINSKDDFKLKFGFPDSHATGYTLAECRLLVRTLFNGLKILSYRLRDFNDSATQPAGAGATPLKTGFFRSRDIPTLIQLFKKGLKLLEMFNTNMFTNQKPQTDQYGRVIGGQGLSQSHRTKEEKEAMETFANIFISLSPQTFTVLMTETIDYFVNCIYENINLHQVAHFLLTIKQTSTIFADILVGYLVERLEVMGNDSELSLLYLKLFKLVFGSVSQFPTENEIMLQPHLHKLVNSSIELALNAKEPYNYFLLLRGLFRSIGGGSHDLLYQEFLPMLPSLLQRLNSLQSGSHRQSMKDLFVELCLTIPVRLSSLLPYLPWLMDPLVSALNGTPNLISQGLRTLELCVDNLQPDFLYEHIQPIRTELMQSLWKILRHTADNISHVSFRILGKLGGSNHKMMNEPLKLNYIDFRDQSALQGVDSASTNALRSFDGFINSYGVYSYVSIDLPEVEKPIHMPIDRVIECAYKGLRSSNTDSFYRAQCWEVIKGFLVANVQHINNAEENATMQKLFLHPSFTSSTTFGYPVSSVALDSNATFVSTASNNFYKYPDEKLRKVHELALTAMITASAIKELHQTVLLFSIPLVRYYTLVAISQQTGLIKVKLHGMDPLVLIDALASVMGQEEKELCKAGHLLLRIIIDVSVSLAGSRERACQLPLFEYMLERFCSLCYERAWYSKYGGCVTLRHFFDRMTLRWLLGHQSVLLKAMLFVIKDLCGELSSGVIDKAKENLETIVNACATPLKDGSNKELQELQQKSMNEVIQELLKQLTNSNTVVREQAMYLLGVVAKATECTITDVIRPHKKIMEDMVPPKKHKLNQQPVNVQIGLLDGNTFCLTLDPQLFVINTEIQEHTNFLNDIYFICKSDDASLQKHACYKSVTSLVPLRKAALRALSACHYIQPWREKISEVLYKALNTDDAHQRSSSNYEELQKCAFDCLQKYQLMKDVDPELFRKNVREILLVINEFRLLDINSFQKLKYLVKLVPNLFTDKFCEQMLKYLIGIIENCVAQLRKRADGTPDPDAKRKFNINEQLDICVHIISLFSDMSSAEPSYMEVLLNFLSKTDNILDTYVSRKFYKPLEEFFKRYPTEAIALLERRMSGDENIFRFMQYLLKQKENEAFRSVLKNDPANLVKTLRATLDEAMLASQTTHDSVSEIMEVTVPASTSKSQSTNAGISSEQANRRYQSVYIVSILVKHDPQWLSSQPELVHLLKCIWLSDAFHNDHLFNFSLNFYQWNEPKLLVKCLLNYIDHNQYDFDIIFQLLRAFNARYNCDFEFLRNYFSAVVMKTFPIKWKRLAFLHFFNLYHNSQSDYNYAGVVTKMNWSWELKAKILQYIVIPSFAHSFEKGCGEQLISASDSPDAEHQSSNQNDLVELFLDLIVNEDSPKMKISDSVRILMQQLACLLVDYAPNYIRPMNLVENRNSTNRNKRQDVKVRRLMSFVWGCLIAKNSLDPTDKYLGHLILAKVISKFAINKKIIRQVFLSLLKAHCSDARLIVRNALDTLIAALPQRTDEGYRMMRVWTKKLILEDGSITAQLYHLLQNIVRYYNIYYYSRHSYVAHICTTINRLGLNNTSMADQRKLSLDLVEVIIRWEMRRVKEEKEHNSDSTPTPMEVSDCGSSDASCSEPTTTGGGGTGMQQSNQLKQPELQQSETMSQGPILKDYSDAIVHFLIRFICTVYEFAPNNSAGSLHNWQNASASSITPDFMCRRALNLLKTAIKNELWPYTEYKIGYLERILSTAKDNSQNYTSICMALELLIAFLQTMKEEAVLQIFIVLQKAIAICCTCTNTKVVRTVHNLLTKMMAIFPPSCVSSTISPKSGAPVKVVNDQLEPLEQLYTEIHSIILSGIGAYNKSGTTPTAPNVPNMAMVNGLGASKAQIGGAQLAQIRNSTTFTLSQLFGTLMILKAACLNQPSYIDRLLTPFMLMLQKLVKEHLNTVASVQQTQGPDFSSALCVEIIILSLELVKNRLSAMSQDTRRAFVQNVFSGLIEKSPEVKVMKTILKIFEEWIKQPLSGHHGPRASSGAMHYSIASVLREKVQLLIRIAHNIEKRFLDDNELNAMFMDMIHYIYSDDTLKSSDLTSKLEFAFLTGLRSNQSVIRSKFFQILDNSVRKRLYDRLMFITCEQNWESMGLNFWIKQCIEIILAISQSSAPLATPDEHATLPLPITFISFTEQHDKSAFSAFSVSNNVDSSITNTDMFSDLDFMFPFSAPARPTTTDVEMTDVSQQSPKGQANPAGAGGATTAAGSGHSMSLDDKKVHYLTNVCEFLSNLKQIPSSSFVAALTQLCHFDNALAQHIWIQLFPRIFATLTERQQLMLSLEISPFLLSGSHTIQRDAPYNSIGTFFEAITYCNPPILIRPQLLKYLSKNHRIWHRAMLLLEHSVEKVHPNTLTSGLGGLINNNVNLSVASNVTATAPKYTRGSMNANSEWQSNELIPAELSVNVQTYKHECAMTLANLYETLNEEDYWSGVWQKHAHYKETLIGIAYEQQGFFEEAKSSFELVMSKARNDYSNQPASFSMNDELCLWERHWIRCSKELNQWDFLLDYGTTNDLPNWMLVLESAWRIPDWDKMSKAIMAMETNMPSDCTWKLALYKGYNAICNSNNRNLEQVEQMVELSTNFLIKEWRRLPSIVSSAHIRILHAAHQVIELQEASHLHQGLFTASGLSHPGLYIHERPQVDIRAVIKTWKNRLPIVADDLSHWSDIFTWRQHHYQAIVSRYDTDGSRINAANGQNSLIGSHASAQSLIHYARIARKHCLFNVSLDSLNRIHTIPKVPIVDCFQKIRQQLKCHLQIHSTNPSGDDLQEGLSILESTNLKFFQNDSIAEFYAMKGHFYSKLGNYEEANRSFSAATQIQDTLVKAWALWGEYYDDLFTRCEVFANRDITLGERAICAYMHACRHQNEAKSRKFLSKVLWLLSYDNDQHKLTIATEHYNPGVPPINWLPWVPQLLQSLVRERDGNQLISIVSQVSKIYPQAVYFPLRTMYLFIKMEVREIKYKILSNLNLTSNDQANTASNGMWRCSRIMHHQRDLNSNVMTTLEGIVDQLMNLREDWNEEILRQLRLALAKCYHSAFETRDNVADACFSMPTFQFLRKLIVTFVSDTETESSEATSVQRRSQITVQDLDWVQMKPNFVKDFSFKGSRKLRDLIVKLKKWIKILEAKKNLSPKSWLLEEKSHYLSNFSNQIGDIALFGEFLLPKVFPAVVSISRFMPRVDIVNKQYNSARRFYVRGHNGKEYPYLVMTDSTYIEARREERFLQLQRLLNLYLGKHKETARRLLNFTVPRVVSIAPNIRVVEDNVSSLSLMEILKQYASISPDNPIARYYERLIAIQAKDQQPTPQHLREILGEIQSSIVPNTLLREWAMQSFYTATDLWQFRKWFTLQLGLANLSEFAFYLSRLNPEMMYIHRDSGLMNISYFRFNLNEDIGELMSNLPVPFRLTSNLQNFVTESGILGPLTATMISTASCLVHPNFKVRSIILVIMRDEIISWYKRVKWNEKVALVSTLKLTSSELANSQQTFGNSGGDSHTDESSAAAAAAELQSIEEQKRKNKLVALLSKQSAQMPEINNEELVSLAKKAVNSIMSRLQSLATVENCESKVATLITMATDTENLSKMDPAWHPWF